ncbi:HAMP domain-containing protein [Candidatus Desantisbacteria bacterium]|nr:HAMP domain-containing protein [Candidatus Desantisbacteria bacterium]
MSLREKISNILLSMNLNNIKIGTKLISSFIIVSILAGITGTIAAIIIAFCLGFFLTLSITRPINKSTKMMQELSNGHLDARLEFERADEIGILAKTMDDFADDLQNNIVSTMKKIADGDLTLNVTAKDNIDEISLALNEISNSLRGLVKESMMLTNAFIEGRLAIRGDINKFHGGYKDIIKGINDTMDAVIGPLNAASEYINRISNGDIPSKITDNYGGDFNKISNNINKCIDAINELIEESKMLTNAAVEGQLATRGNINKLPGGYQDIIKGINDTIDAVTIPLNAASEYIDRIGNGDIPSKITDNYSGDFNKIKNNLNKCIEAINNLIIDANLLAQSAIEGKLDIRADENKHDGDFKKIINGINQTFDAIGKQIGKTAQVLNKVAAKNLKVRIMSDFKGDYAKIKESLNTALDNLDKGLQQAAALAKQVTSTASQIGSGNQTLSQGNLTQASSIEEVASNMQEMNSMTKQNTSNSMEARNMAETAKSSAEKGVENMKKMSDAMNRIKKSASDTEKIIKTIDEIAFQTNLLALNAAVEAARAGEAGKGFAVVAEEVRNLAMRSSEAAKNTSDMILESIKNADDGVSINKEVMTNLEDIDAQVKKVSGIMDEITIFSEQQNRGIDQINQTIGQLNQLTQQNAANARESAGASEELSAQAQEMTDIINTFEISLPD